MKPKPASIKWGKPNECFANAHEVVAASAGRYQYVWGFATLSHDLTDVVLGPELHAWVFDPEDQLAFDVTWRPPLVGVEYFGMIDAMHMQWPNFWMEVPGSFVFPAEFAKA
jgi:hypothetical protein